MYLNNLVVVIKHNNKVLRERGGSEVILPFGSEYSILIKNLNSKRVSVNVSIDGEDILDNNSLLLDANSSFELDGFIDSMSAKNRFRFIKKTKQISNYRGDRVDDGLVRVEFAYEAPYNYSHTIKYNNMPNDATVWCDYTPTPTNIRYCYGEDSTSNNYMTRGEVNGKCLYTGCFTDLNLDGVDEGITVKGSKMKQDFIYGSIGALEESNVMIIHLCGEKTNGTAALKPITVKTRLRCKTCGMLSRSNAKFCSNCGTFLE